MHTVVSVLSSVIRHHLRYTFVVHRSSIVFQHSLMVRALSFIDLLAFVLSDFSCCAGGVPYIEEHLLNCNSLVFQ